MGTPNYIATQLREKKILRWLDSIEKELHALFLLGDIFDFWFEYKHVIPKGFVRLQSKLASFTDRNIPVYLLVGNHDCWLQDYFLKELNIQVLYDSVILDVYNKKLLIGHGDGLSNNRLFKLLRRYIYRGSVLSWIFRNIPTGLCFNLVDYISKINSNRHILRSIYPPKDFIFEYCKAIIEPCMHYDYYIFGHLHFPYSKSINDFSTYFNIGDWITHFSYGIFDGVEFRLKRFE